MSILNSIISIDKKLDLEERIIRAVALALISGFNRSRSLEGSKSILLEFLAYIKSKRIKEIIDKMQCDLYCNILKFIDENEDDIVADIVFLSKNENFEESELLRIIGDIVQEEFEKKSTGTVFTPGWLANLITKRTFGYWGDGNETRCANVVRAADICSGTGIFLNSMTNQSISNQEIIGLDINDIFVGLSRLFFYGDDISIFSVDSVLSESDYLSHESYDVIVGNPPYIRSQSLDTDYKTRLKEKYSDVINGNFDLTVPFIKKMFEMLDYEGVCGIVISNKLLQSKYGRNICEFLVGNTKILEIIDFGDGQLFDGRTTYVAVIIFQKVVASNDHTLKITQFPKGLKWKDDTNMSIGQSHFIRQSELRVFPWSLKSSSHVALLDKFTQNGVALLSVFEKVIQGIRTGANSIYIHSADFANKSKFEDGILVNCIETKCINGINISPTKKVIWPYSEKLKLIDWEGIITTYPVVGQFLFDNKEDLANRKGIDNENWYQYSRPQNLDCIRRKKIFVREMMASAEFSVDLEYSSVFTSGYGILPYSEMTNDDLMMWALILSTPVMEYQQRHISTQLHSGWYRMLKSHLVNTHLPVLSKVKKKEAMKLVTLLKNDGRNSKYMAELNELVGQAFDLSSEEIEQINTEIENIHSVSKKSKSKVTSIDGKNSNDIVYVDCVEKSKYKELSKDQRMKYYPIELTPYNEFHVEDSSYSSLVTFKDSKVKPVYRWYKYTQGFSDELVRRLLDENDIGIDKTIFDPFCGSGTTLLAAKLRGNEVYGADISPLMTWITDLKLFDWDITTLKNTVNSFNTSRISDADSEKGDLLFLEYFNKAFSPLIFEQILNIKNRIEGLTVESKYKDFLKLALIGILEEISVVRKHGSHYRFLNKHETVGVKKLNIKVIEEDANIHQIFNDKVNSMIRDLIQLKELKPNSSTSHGVFNISTTEESIPQKIDVIITSPPYLNRNNYFSQQKSELSILNLLDSKDEYKKLVKKSFKSHVEAELTKDPYSSIPEIKTIVEAVQRQECNNAKIPSMIAGYFEDMKLFLRNVKKSVVNDGHIFMVVGNCRWNGVVIPVDHLLTLIAEREGFTLEKIIVARHKGNSPQQMKKYGRIPVRESIVHLRMK